MITLTEWEIESRAKEIINQLSENGSGALSATLVAGESAIGGGAGPTTTPSTSLIALTHETLSALEIETLLRSSSPPVIARIADGKVLIDLRTVFMDEESHLVNALKSI
jgi:L-seryl-tRNA(Ser) seleniumtransferase